MSLAQQVQFLASALWLVILLGPPLALALLAPMMYVDGATRGIPTASVRTDNRVTLLLLLLSFAGWVAVLKFLYLPAIGFDTDFLTFTGMAHYNYGDLQTLGTLWGTATHWAGHSPLQAAALLGCVALVVTAVLVIARELGRAATRPVVRHPYWS